MKTFKNLEFDSHPVGIGKAAKLFFDNGYGISVVRFKTGSGGYLRNGYGSYTTNETEWEVAVLVGTADEWEIAYNTPITNDVIGYCSVRRVTAIMKRIQSLKA